MMKNDTFESLVPGQKFSGPKSIGPKYFQAEVYKRAEVLSGPKYISGPKYFPGRSCFGPKYFRAKVFWAEVFLGRSECRAKAVSGPNWV